MKAATLKKYSQRNLEKGTIWQCPKSSLLHLWSHLLSRSCQLGPFPVLKCPLAKTTFKASIFQYYDSPYHRFYPPMESSREKTEKETPEFRVRAESSLLHFGDSTENNNINHTIGLCKKGRDCFLQSSFFSPLKSPLHPDLNLTNMGCKMVQNIIEIFLLVQGLARGCLL